MILAVSLFCRNVIFAEDGVDERGEQLVEARHPLGDGGEVVINIAEVQAHLQLSTSEE